MNRKIGLLSRARRALGTDEEPVAYRLTLERESDASRATYEQRVKSLTQGLEASIRDAGSGSFESLSVSRTGGPYSQTMNAIEKEKVRVKDLGMNLTEFEENSSPLLSRLTVSDVRSEYEEADRKLKTLRNNRLHRVKNTFAYQVSFAPKSPQTIEAIASEFERLSTLDSVEAVEFASDTPDDDPRNSIDTRAQENQNR
jgi:hypothetical protein